MDYLNGMFKSYMKSYGNVTKINQGEEIMSFFQEIKESNSLDNKYLYAEKKLINQGDLLTINNKMWIVLHEDITYHSPYSRYVVSEANNKINFVIDESLYTTYGTIDTGSQSVNNGSVSILDGKIKLTVQLNESTLKIKPNDRIIKFGMAWKVLTTTCEDNGLQYVYCETNSILAEDDLENEIPKGVATWTIEFTESIKDINLGSNESLYPIVKKNDVVVTEGYNLFWESSNTSVASIDTDGVLSSLTVGSTTIKAIIEDKGVENTLDVNVINDEVIEYKITPEDRIVYAVNVAPTFTVNKYINGVVASETFTITASGLETRDYELNVIDGNSFELKSEGFSATPLTVKCVADSDGFINEEDFNMYMY